MSSRGSNYLSSVPGWIWAVGSVVVLLLVGFGFWQWLGSEPEAPLEVRGESDPASQPSNENTAADAEYVMVGGVRRRRSDVEPVKGGRLENHSESDPSDAIPDYGVAPAVALDANPQVESVVEALQDKGSHPERLSVMVQPAKFDPQAYQAEPAAYLNTIEPGRVFQTAQPGPKVVPIQSLNPRLIRTMQGEPVELRVRVKAGAPVTFTSFDLGQFDNQLTSITVQADEYGVAQANFTGTGGTVGDVNILAGSPLASGQAKFVVDVQLPSGNAAEGAAETD